MKKIYKYNIILMMLCVLILNFSCYSHITVKAFDIPSLVNKDITQVTLKIGPPNHFTDEGNMRWANYSKITKDDLVKLSINFNPNTNQIEYFLCSTQNYYTSNDFMIMANVDTISNEYRVEVPMDDMVNSKDHYYAITIYPLTATMVFDIPNLVGKNIDNLCGLLGNDLLITREDDDKNKSIKECNGAVKKEGYTLFITFNSKNKKVSLMQIVADKGGFLNPKDMLTIGNLDSTNKSYSCVLGRSSSLGNKFNSVTIYPKNN